MEPLLSDQLVVWRSFDGGVYRLMVARRTEAEVTATIPVAIRGDTKVEPDEQFQLIIDGATASVLTGTVQAVIDDASATIVILNDDGGKDFGDAPASYGEASHSILKDAVGDPLLALGSTVDPENSSRTSDDATADDNDLLGDDEDGLVSLTSAVGGDTIDGLVAGQYATLTIDVTNGTGNDAYLSAWIDLNGDGLWADYTDAEGNPVSERVIAARAVGDGQVSRRSSCLPAFRRATHSCGCD